MTLQESMRALLVRDLGALRRELEAYEDESQIWAVPVGITNSAGTLALHLVGNLRAFIGAALGHTGYERDRPAEFARRDVARAEILRDLEHTVEEIETTLDNLSQDRLSQPFPIVFGELRVDTADFLLHLATHLAFHLGQIDYHRRLVTAQGASVGPIAIPELASARTGG